MWTKIAQLSLLVPDYDEAIAYYTGVFGFTLLEDTPLDAEPGGKRWVVLAPAGSGSRLDGEQGARLLLARAANAEQASRIGNQTGGRVFLFLHTDDFAGDHARLVERGVEMLGAPRREAYGEVVVCVDRYGNKWDLIGPRG